MISIVIFALSAVITELLHQIGRRLPDQPPLDAMLTVSIGIPLTILTFGSAKCIFYAVPTALFAWIIWNWWRRRRQGKPSRVLGIVRDLGHRLTVVNVPAQAPR